MKTLLTCVFFFCCAFKFPDKGGITDFDHPECVRNGVFILTNPRSGSHLLLASISCLTQRPIRGRVPLWHFLNDPPFRQSQNPLKLPINFNKPTIYWGHEYGILNKLNHHQNRLIFTRRNYKLNILSILNVKYRFSESLPCSNIESLLKKEILSGGMIFKEYIKRLKLYDAWNPKYRLLIEFEDLVTNPKNFVPHLLTLLNEDPNPTDFFADYDTFKTRVRQHYDTKGVPTVSKNNARYFNNYISPNTHKLLDLFVQRQYPKLWTRYLSLDAFEDS